MKHILAEAEVDFLESLYQALYFRCGEKWFCLKNGSAPGLTNKPCTLQHEEVIVELTAHCKNFKFCHKLYADGRPRHVGEPHWSWSTASCSAHYVKRIRTAHKTSAIFAVKGHSKIAEEIEFRGIPITTEYCYLGVLLNHSGNIEPHFKKIRQSSTSICMLTSANMYSTCHLKIKFCSYRYT